MILVGIIVVIVALALFAISIYNGIVTKRNRCDNAWQQIDAQLQRRSDLIPNLVETVKAYAKHESETFDAIARARSAMSVADTPKDKMVADDALSGALRQLFAVAEAYPELKANTNFQQLQTQLEESENKIVYARQSFNDCVLIYNNAIQTFPGSVLASGLGFEPKSGFEVTDASARQTPKVEF